MTFQQRIKALKSEIEALKTVRSKSSLVLNTTTKTATCAARLYKTSTGVVVCQYSGLIEINPSNTDNEPLIGYSQPSYSARGNREIDLTPWVKSDGTLGILCTPDAASSDSSMSAGATKDITITVYITATDDFTTTSSQVRSY